jgi:hypothetical protein
MIVYNSAVHGGTERAFGKLSGGNPSDAPSDTERLTSRLNPLRVANLANLSNK